MILKFRDSTIARLQQGGAAYCEEEMQSEIAELRQQLENHPNIPQLAILMEEKKQLQGF